MNPSALPPSPARGPAPPSGPDPPLDEPEQLLLGAMPQRLFACTPSRLAAFDCPRRYRFTYLERPTPVRGLPWAHNTVGAVVHLALAQWWALPPARRTPEIVGELVERNWQSNGFRDDAQAAQYQALARAWVERYVRDTAERDEPVGVERTVSMPTSVIALSGRVDRIDDRDGELVIVDYKTGRRELTDDDARSAQALALYALAARRTLRRSCRRVELHHVPSGRVGAFTHTEDTLERHLGRAEATAHDIQVATDTLAAGATDDEAFPPVTGPGCSWCDFRQHCPEGRAAAPDREPWAGLIDPQAATP